MFQSILSNIAIILLLHLIMTVIMNYRNKISPFLLKFFIIFINSAAVISMFYLPIRFDGYWVDMRFIPLVFLAYLQGFRLAIPALLISSLWRIFMGGDGMIPGIIFGMIGPTLFALSLHHRSNLQGHFFEKIGMIIGCWFICDFPIIFIMPNGFEIFKSIALIRSTSFILTAITLYSFIILERQRTSSNEKLQRLAGEDPLTKLLNKRKLFEMIGEKVQHFSPEHYIAMIDIDHFKQLNDHYGHVIGDQVLVKTGEILKQYEKENIAIGRYGGEEFIVYIGDTTFDEATKLIETIRQDIRTASFVINNEISIQITVSIGLAPLTENDPLLHVINLADKNLYQAKRNGRDCLIVSTNHKVLGTERIRKTHPLIDKG